MRKILHFVPVVMIIMFLSLSFVGITNAKKQISNANSYFNNMVEVLKSRNFSHNIVSTFEHNGEYPVSIVQLSEDTFKVSLTYNVHLITIPDNTVAIDSEKEETSVNFNKTKTLSTEVIRIK